MSYLDQIEWCDTPLVSPTPNTEIEKQINRHLGFSMSIIPYLAPVPWVAWSFAGRVHPIIHISGRLSDLIELVVSMENSCRHCYGAVRSILRITGYSEKQISRLEEDLYHSETSEKERMMLTFARKCARADPRPGGADLEALEAAGYSRPAIAEAVYIATSTCYANLVATIIGIPPDDVERMEQHWVSRLLRPLVTFGYFQFSNRAKQRNIKKYRTPASRGANTGLGAQLVGALEGSPTAGVLRTVLDEAWASTVCSTKTKALIIAIVARSLDCPVCIAEACTLLKAEGFRQGHIDQLLSYLHSDQLSPLESKIVHFARESVSYRVPVLQTKARQLSVNLSREEIIEIAAVIGLANWMGRLSVILQQYAPA